MSRNPATQKNRNHFAKATFPLYSYCAHSLVLYAFKTKQGCSHILYRNCESRLKIEQQGEISSEILKQSKDQMKAHKVPREGPRCKHFHA